MISEVETEEEVEAETKAEAETEIDAELVRDRSRAEPQSAVSSSELETTPAWRRQQCELRRTGQRVSSETPRH